MMFEGILPGLRNGNNPIGPVGDLPVSLALWNVFEDEEVYSELLNDYKALYPHVTINYRKIDYIEYREKLNQAFIAGSPPDIYAIHNTWLPLEESRITPAPGNVAAVASFNEIFPPVVAFDFTRELKVETEAGAEQEVGEIEGSVGAKERTVYALPLAMETLGLFYNKDYFEAANIATPPKTWEELLDYVKLFTQFDDTGSIKLSGVALGAADNVNRAADILALFMLQGGARMNNEFLTEATFDKQVWIGEGEKQIRFKPGEEALAFYLAFADRTKSVYSWDKSMPYSIDAFVEGKAAMMINYPHHIPIIVSKAPHLNFGVAALPQLKDSKESVDYASYWGFTVSKNSVNSQTAWGLIDFMLEPENLKKYLEKANMPTARRDLILWQQQDERLRYFANQTISAKSWYQGDSVAAEKILLETITSALVGERTIPEALGDAAARITVIIQKTIPDTDNNSAQ